MEKRPSWKCTAFWVNAVTIAITVLSAVAEILTPEAAAGISAGLAAVFTIANAITKLRPPAEQ